MLVPGRRYNSEKYRFAFNGKESDPEWKGTTGAVYDYGFRIYDARIAKFLSVDPLAKAYPMLTPYQFASNTPIWAFDLDGLESSFYEVLMEQNGKAKLGDTKKGSSEFEEGAAEHFENMTTRKYWVDKLKSVRDYLVTSYKLNIAQDPEAFRELGTNVNQGVDDFIYFVNNASDKDWGRFSAQASSEFLLAYFWGYATEASLLKNIKVYKNLGGRMDDLPIKSGFDRHEFPSKSVLNKFGVKKGDAAAIQVETPIHSQTGSYGLKKSAFKYRAKEFDLIKQGKLNEAWQKGLDDFKKTLDEAGGNIDDYDIPSMKNYYFEKVVPQVKNYLRSTN